MCASMSFFVSALALAAWIMASAGSRFARSQEAGRQSISDMRLWSRSIRVWGNIELYVVVYLTMWRGLAEAQVHRMTRFVVSVAACPVPSGRGSRIEAVGDMGTNPGGTVGVDIQLDYRGCAAEIAMLGCHRHKM